MTNALFDPDETESERTVIISERQGSENSPTFWLKEEMRAAAFRVHGYHHMILGDMTDLNTLTRDDLYTHYRQHYTPQNAVIVCVGAFKADEMLQKIEDMFGDVPPGEPAQIFVRDEPPQQGERRVSVQRPGDTAVLSLAYRVPEATHADWFALEVLDSVLTGSSSSDNKTTRLYRALVKSGVAASISGGLVESIDPYLYTINTTLNDGHTPDEAEQIILDVIQQVQQDGISADELTRARKQARASFAYATESITNQAYWLAQSAMLNDIHWFDTYLDRLAAVTLADVQRVAKTYLVPARRTVGTLLPEATETV
jgi:zinc protease